jgi:putative SOS response-associated peptidase YedK
VRIDWLATGPREDDRMCGRFTLRVPVKEMALVFDFETRSLFPAEVPRYNIAPTQPIAAVRVRPGHDQRELVALRWGLIPSWADDPAIGNRMINARAESVATKPSFRAAFKSRRCLIPADGYYEWQKVEGRKRPYIITRKDGKPFAFAGLWEHWESKGDAEVIESATILTTEANDLTRSIHDRMPVILNPGDYTRWLDPESGDPQALQTLLVPYQGKGLTAYPVSTAVNNPKNENPKCVEPLS